MRLSSWVVVAVLSVAPGTRASGARPHALVIATPHDPDARASEVRLLDGARPLRATPVPHARGAVARGDARGEIAFVVVDEDGSRDPDFGAALLRVDASGASRLIGGVLHASRPLASSDGRVYVERGARGPQRIDALTIDAIDARGAAVTLFSSSCYALHIAGEAANEIIIYRVHPSGAEILGVDRTTGAPRVVASVPPYARDFSIDGSALVMSNRDASDARRWIVARVDLRTGAVARLHDEVDDAPAAFALAGSVAWSAPRRAGLFVDGAIVAPLGAGFDDVRAASGADLLVAHVPPSGFDETYLYDRATGVAIDLSRGRERVEPIGFVGSGAVLR